LKRLILKIYDKAEIKSSRTKQIVKHIGWSFLFKVGSVIANFLLVPITINYLSVENYGIWLTLTSFIAWFSFFDIGLGNGLRNKFAEAKALGKYEDAQALVSTAYYTIACISLFLVLVFFILNYFVDWTLVFNTSVDLRAQLSILLPIIFSFFGLQLVVKLITSIYQADQHHSIQDKIQFYGQFSSLLVIWLLTKTSHSSLLLFGSIFSALPVMILVGLNLFAFKTNFSNFKPKFSLWKKKHLKEIMGLGFNFFVIQIAALVLFSTDNFIITRLFSPAEVVPYNVAFKYFSIVTMVYTILITPYWSSFTDAYSKKDFDWIKKSVHTIQKIWFLIPITLFLMTLGANWFYVLWVGDSVIVPIHLSLAMALFVALLTFNMIYVYFINGVGKIGLQLISSVVSMILNIPLSIYFAKYLEWGTTGVILATCFCLLYTTALWPIQYKKLVDGKAFGIWNK
jgi:O-antigen/teichoic acid export membrane protein